MTKLLVGTEGFQIWPKLNEEFRIGPVVGRCKEHILNEEGKCTHIIMDNVSYTSHFIEVNSRKERECLSSFGIVECPHVPDKFCNIQFEDGSHCESCAEPTKYRNRHFLQTQAMYHCPLMKDNRISVCFQGCEIEQTDLRDKCIKCCEDALNKHGWESSARCLTYTNVQKPIFRSIIEQYITYLEVRLDVFNNYDSEEDLTYIVEDYLIFQDLMKHASVHLGLDIPFDDPVYNGGSNLQKAVKEYKAKV